MDVNNTLKSVLQLKINCVSHNNSICLLNSNALYKINVLLVLIQFCIYQMEQNNIVIAFSFSIRLVCNYQRLNVKSSSKNQTVQVGASQKTLNFQTFLLNKSLFGYKQWFTGGHIHYPHVGNKSGAIRELFFKIP